MQYMARQGVEVIISLQALFTFFVYVYLLVQSTLQFYYASITMTPQNLITLDFIIANFVEGFI